MKILLAVVIVVILAAAGAVLFWPSGTDTPRSQSSSGIQNQATKDPNSGTPLLIVGDKNAPVTVTEYGDFKCPNCAKFHTSTGQGIRKDYVKTGDVRIVFRNLALIGPDSERAAQGGYCANDQNKFTQYHDAVYEYIWNNYYQKGNFQVEAQDILNTDLLAGVADDLDINVAKFKSCLSNQKYASATQADLDAAEADGARGTPFFVIGDRTIVGPQPYSVFETLIDLQLQ